MTKPRGTASMLLLDYPVRANEIYLYNNNIDGSKPEMLYHKVGPNVEFATNFSGFYNMNISDKAPYISLMRSGGKKRSKRRRTKKRKISKKQRNNKITNKRRISTR